SGCVDADEDRPWIVWALPPIAILWVNLHGGWLVGGAVYGAWLLGYLVRRRSRGLPFVMAAVVAVAATLLNPYGIGMWRFLFGTVGLSRQDITDWQPLYHAEGGVVIAWFATTAAVA